jgi:hypothetical protein
MKKSKKIELKSQYDVIHLFANGITNLSKNNVRSTGNRLYYHSMMIAIKYRNIVFIRSFDRSGSYGGGLNGYNVGLAFDKDKYKTFMANDLRDNLQYNIEQSVQYMLDSEQDKIANIYRVIYNPRLSANHNNDIIVNNLDYNELLDIFKHRVKRKFLSKKITKVYGTYYEGWNSYSYSYPINISIKQFFNNKIFTDREKEIYNAKRFWYVNVRGLSEFFNHKGIKTSTLKDKIFIYTDEETRNRILKLNKDIAKRKAEALLEKHRKDIETNYDRIIRWMKGEELTNLYLGGYDLIISSGLRIKGDEVITSMCVSVPISHARALYKIFKECERTDTEFEANGTSIKIGHYRVEFIKKGICHSTEQYYLKAGCHYISSDIINKFIEINKLNW